MTTQSEKVKLDLSSIILLGINTIIGSGIFLLPGQVADVAGAWSFAVFGFVTLLVMSIAWCFAKCAAIFNQDGGAYLYAKHAFGDFIGFEIGIMRWAVGIMAWASLAVGFVTALSTLWPQVLLEPNRTLLILGMIGGLGLLNTLNLGAIKSLNNIVTVAKLLPLIFFVFIGIFYIKQSNLITPLPEFDSEGFGSATLMLFYAFAGFEALVVPAGEMQNPQKNLPIAVMVTISICALLYFCIQIIAMGALGPALPDSVSPMSDVAEMILGPSGKLAITLAMLISIGGINIAASFIVPKTAQALANDRMIPSFIAKQNRYGTPYVAILITILITSFLALSGDFTELVTISVVSRFAQHISTCLAVYVFYNNRLTLKQPIFELLPMLIPLIGLGGIFWLIFQTPTYQLVAGMAALIISIPFYFWWRPKAVEAPV